MRLTLYVFHFSSSGVVKRMPLAKWNRLHTKQEKHQAFSGQSVRIAYAYVELENRKPVYCHRIDGVIYHFDSEGIIHDNPLPPIDLLSKLNIDTEGVINMTPIIARHRYDASYCWQLNGNDIQRVVDVIW